MLVVRPKTGTKGTEALVAKAPSATSTTTLLCAFIRFLAPISENTVQRAFELAAFAIVATVCLAPGNVIAQVCTDIASVPAVITRPGLYCLKRDLAFTGSSGAAITIEANNVTLDLNGFRLGGGGGGSGTLASGVYATDRRNITIRNGIIRAFRTNVALNTEGDGSSNTGHVVENLRTEGALRTGILVAGWRSIVRDNVVISTVDPTADGAVGILATSSRGTTISGNVVSGVSSGGAASGIKVVSSSLVTIERNRILDITGTPSKAIEATSTAFFVTTDNVTVNTSAGTTGIEGGGSHSTCLENVIVNFTTPLSACDIDEGNRTF